METAGTIWADKVLPKHSLVGDFLTVKGSSLGPRLSFCEFHDGRAPSSISAEWSDADVGSHSLGGMVPSVFLSYVRKQSAGI